MGTISKIIIGIAIVYIAAVLIVLDYQNMSWEVNGDNYLKLMAGVFFIVIQFFIKKDK